MAKSKKTSSILGIDKNFIADSFKGLLIGLVIVFLGKIFSFVGAIGIPLNLAIGLDDLGRILVIGFIAPVVEEIFFRQFVLSFFDDKLEKNFNIKIPFIFSAIITGVIFAIFHLAAYGGSLSAAGGSFFSASLIGVLFAYQVKWFKSIIPSIITHMVLNLSILASLSVVVG